jgi:hypothetical protein
VVGTTAAAGATAGVVMSGGLLAPAAGAMIGGVTGSIASDLMTESSEIKNDIQRGESIFLLAEKAVRVAGWWLVLLFVAPWLLGWAMPGPMKFKKLNGKGHE